jgi:GntR family transcriptional regulator
MAADVATGDEALPLKTEIGSPVLRTRRMTLTRRNQPIEYATSVYRGDTYRFHTHLVRDRS